MQLQGLIKNLEYRLQKTDQATIEAKEIRDELHKLRKIQVNPGRLNFLQLPKVNCLSELIIFEYGSSCN